MVRIDYNLRNKLNSHQYITISDLKELEGKYIEFGELLALSLTSDDFIYQSMRLKTEYNRNEIYIVHGEIYTTEEKITFYTYSLI